ncbi:DNA helicase [Oryzifoliimicrobium ureilyticus]|uniref:DNA helicase n=1 Tax=Oryzifoliimicrobium ureilyticus TaxID=3113724 RepID=UPI00307604BA
MKLSAPLFQLKRRAKLTARREGTALHLALDAIAREEGFASWSLLSSRLAKAESSPEIILQDLEDGDLILLAARRGHGKTMLALRLLVEAAKSGRRSIFYTLEYTERQALWQIERLGHARGLKPDAIEIVTSEAISAGYILDHLGDGQPGAIAVVDYLQILDQQRSKPPLRDQMEKLQAYAAKSGMIFVFISQLDRAFDGDGKTLPELADIRLPNQIDLNLFSKACFLHDGMAALRHLAA